VLIFRCLAEIQHYAIMGTFFAGCLSCYLIHVDYQLS
jgi:hypothetical protein